MKQQPFRMCIACREAKPKNELIKIVKNKLGQVEIDLQQKKAGRGAYICMSEACHIKLNKQKMLNKAFSMMINDEVYENIKTAYENLKNI